VVAVHLGLDALAANDRSALARQAVETWATTAGRPPIGESAYLTAALAMGDSTRSAAVWLQSLPASEERDTALVELPAHWVRTHPRDAVEWAASDLPPHLRLRGLRRAFSEWIDRNPSEAAAWLIAHLARSPADPDSEQLAALLNLARNPASDE
jgi:hypothetical protein